MITEAQLNVAREEYTKQHENLLAQIRALDEQRQELDRTVSMLLGALAAIEALRKLPPAPSEPTEPRDE